MEVLERLLAARLGSEDLVSLFAGARDGHLCSFDIGDLPAHLVSEGKENQPFPTTPLISQGNRLYLHRNWAVESLILQKVREILAREAEAITLEEIASFPQLQEAQVKALYMGSKSSLTIFTGGPGTGKTFTAGCFIRLLAKDKPFKVAIAAPTGKAAANLETSLKAQGPLPATLQCESTTLHRLLKLQPGMQRFHSDLKINADLIVVDEASMLDPQLMLHLFNGVKTRVLLLGDPDQLPPIEGGSLFPEIADLFGQKLERSMRMGDGPLFSMSQAILRGEFVECEPVDWTSLIDRLCALPISEESDPARALEQQKKFRILSCLRQGPFGVDAINQAIYSRFRGVAVPILIVQNDPKQQLYNGTTGVLIRNVAYFESVDGIRSIPAGKLPRYELAFCLSVHKSQGSEYDQVIALFPPGSERFGKEALYTAVTRAKKGVRLWMDPSTLEAALKGSSRKRSGFTERFKIS